MGKGIEEAVFASRKDENLPQISERGLSRHHGKRVYLVSMERSLIQLASGANILTIQGVLRHSEKGADVKVSKRNLEEQRYWQPTEGLYSVNSKDIIGIRTQRGYVRFYEVNLN